MTEAEYNAAKQSGDIKQDAPTLADLGISAEPAAPSIATPAEDTEGLLYHLRNPLPTLTTIPTTPPRDVTDQFRAVEINGAYYLYVWAGGAWRRSQLDAPKLQAEMYTLVIPGSTNVDTAATHDFTFPPKMVIGTARYTGDNAWAWGIFVDTPTGPQYNAAALPGSASGAIAGGNFLGLATGSPGTYVRNLSVSGNTLHFYYGNSSLGSVTVDLWAIGTPDA